MKTADKLDKLIYTVDEALAILDEMIMQERSEFLNSAFDHLEQSLNALCEAHFAYGKDKK